jgi:hypothetical protein
VVALAILVGLAATNIIPIAKPNSTPTPSRAAPSASVDASESPSASPVPSPTPSPPQAALYPACTGMDEAAPLALRIESFSHTGRDWLISVYDDGRVLTPGLTYGDWVADANDGAWMLARRLAQGGIAQLLENVRATGLFSESASYGAVSLPNVEPPGRGNNGYRITIGSGADAVVVSWVSMYPDDAEYYEPSAEREVLDALGARMIAFDTWLADAAWAERDPCTVQALRFRVFIDAQPYGGYLAELPPDMTDVPWPLSGEILGWGTDVGYQAPDEPYHIERCGIVQRADASRLADELRDAGALDPFSFPATLDGGPYIELDLGDRDANRIIQIFVQPVLPDDTQCTISSRPSGGGI